MVTVLGQGPSHGSKYIWIYGIASKQMILSSNDGRTQHGGADDEKKIRSSMVE